MLNRYFQLDFRRRPVRQYVFIVTYARSGSSLLQSLISSADGAYIAGENTDALWGLYKSYASALESKTTQGSQPREASGDPWRGAHRIDPERYNARIATAFVDEIIRPPSSASIVGFKEVRYFDHDDDLEPYLDYLRGTFQPCLLVFNQRDAEAVAQSGWWKDHPDDIAGEVRKFDKRMRDYAAGAPEDCIVLRYEDYVSVPETLRPLFARIGAKWDRSAIDKVLATRLTH